MEIHFKIIGVLFITLALVHTIFPKYFNWKEELKCLSLMNKQMMEVHTFFIALVVFLMGFLCLFYSFELTSTKFGKAISFGLFIFWFIRLMFQFFVYSSNLWKGKIFETIVHIGFSLLWIYVSSIFFINYLIPIYRVSN